MSQQSWPTRQEVRLVGVNAASASGLSTVLMHAIGFADIGWFDGHSLFDYLQRQGLKPRWVEPSKLSAIRVVDPVAGDVLLQCGSATVTLH